MSMEGKEKTFMKFQEIAYYMGKMKTGIVFDQKNGYRDFFINILLEFLKYERRIFFIPLIANLNSKLQINFCLRSSKSNFLPPIQSCQKKNILDPL